MSGEECQLRAWADINLSAVSDNLNVVRETCPNQTILPVIKANGYGHGLEEIANQLMKDTRGMEGVAVAAMSEAQRLRDCGVTVPVILLPGFVNLGELQECKKLNIEPVVHSKYQVEMLLSSHSDVFEASFRRLWLKGNTGMNRLGMSVSDWRESYVSLSKAFPDTKVIVMSHLACADDVTSGATLSQVEQLKVLTSDIGVGDGSVTQPRRSLAASGGILAWPQTHCDIVRPGIMLYGSSPLPSRSAEECGLRPVMTLRSRVIAINEVGSGDAVGYGAKFVPEKPMRIGVVSIGYGDGYPRQAPSGTPVLVASCSADGGMRRVQLAGRVSMDMITIDLTDVPDAVVGAEVVLWGEGLSADEIASLCETIAYELFCQVTPRVPRLCNWTHTK